MSCGITCNDARNFVQFPKFSVGNNPFFVVHRLFIRSSSSQLTLCDLHILNACSPNFGIARISSRLVSENSFMDWEWQYRNSLKRQFWYHYRPHPKDDGRLYFQSVHTCGGGTRSSLGRGGGYPIQPWTGGDTRSNLGWGGYPIQPWMGGVPQPWMGGGTWSSLGRGGGFPIPCLGGYPNLGWGRVPHLVGGVPHPMSGGYPPPPLK